jgi:hypothetical protein
MPYPSTRVSVALAETHSNGVRLTRQKEVNVRVCAECGGELAAAFRFCPWCAAPQRSKLVEFFRAHPLDEGKALRVSRYLSDEPHVRFSVWSEDGVAEAAVSLEEDEAGRLSLFLGPASGGLGAEPSRSARALPARRGFARRLLRRT